MIFGIVYASYGGLREWQAFGNLNNGANAGLSCVNGNNSLTNTNWNIGGRNLK